MSTHLLIEKTEAIKLLDSSHSIGDKLLGGIEVEYQTLVDNNTWENIQDGMLNDWATRFHHWIEDTKVILKSIFLAGTSKAATFEKYSTANTRLGQKRNPKFVTITGKIRNRLSLLNQMLTDVEQHGVSNQTTVSVTNSPGSVINTGVIEGGIVQNVGTIRQGGNDELAKLFEGLLEAIRTSGDQEAMPLLMQQLQALSNEVKKPTDSRNQTLIKAAWEYIGNFAKLATIGNFLLSHGPKFATLLHLI